MRALNLLSVFFALLLFELLCTRHSGTNFCQLCSDIVCLECDITLLTSSASCGVAFSFVSNSQPPDDPLNGFLPSMVPSLKPCPSVVMKIFPSSLRANLGLITFV